MTENSAVDEMRIVLADVPMSHLKGEVVTESPNLGILYLIAYAKEHLSMPLEITYLEPFLPESEHLKKVGEIQPEIYGISFTTLKKDVAYRLIGKVADVTPHALIVSGGVHPTVDPDDVFDNSETDICVVGEGEETFCEIIANRYKGLSLKGIRGSFYRGEKQSSPRPLLQDIDFLPAWDIIDFTKYDGPVRKKKPFVYLLPSRGCHKSPACEFCSNPVWRLHKPWIRLRSPRNIAKEVELLHSMGVREIYLRCDTFNSDLKWAIAVCEEIKKLEHEELLFQCNLRADNFDEDLASALESINCWLVHIGLESMNDRVLKGVHKGITTDDTLRTLKMLKEHDIKTYGFFMIYNAWEEDGKIQFETSEEVENTIARVKKLLKDGLLTYISWAVTNPIIGSRLHDVAERHGIQRLNSNFPMSIPNVSEAEMNKNYRKGLALQLWNGFEKKMIKPNDVRVLRKVRTLVNLLMDEMD